MQTRPSPVTDRWLATIGGCAQTLFWAIGYFFGFTLVTIGTLGLVVPAAFAEIDRKPAGRARLFYRRHSRFWLAAEIVAAIGWCFLGVVSLWWYRFLL